jgi:hypothetical protein
MLYLADCFLGVTGAALFDEVVAITVLEFGVIFFV